MVLRFPSNSKFIEIGSWKGQSSAYMTVEIINSGKNIKFFCIDTWEGSEEHQEFTEVKNLYQIFKDNMKPLENYYIDIRKTSLEAAKIFDDNSIDFVFIDASHKYEDVKNDINTWLPKVKKGGILAGHDYFFQSDVWPEVRKAVDELLINIKFTNEGCWIYDVI